MSPASSGEDPNIAPYPGRYEAARTKGVAPNEDPVPLDITGMWDFQQQVGRIAELVERTGIGGGWDCLANRVVVLIELGTDNTQTLLDRIRALDDDRIVLHTFTLPPGVVGWVE